MSILAELPRFLLFAPQWLPDESIPAFRTKVESEPQARLRWGEFKLIVFQTFEQALQLLQMIDFPLFATV